MENTQLTLNLQTENKGGVVSGGELTIFLDGPTVDLGSVPNGSAVTDGECRPAPWGCAGMGQGWGGACGGGGLGSRQVPAFGSHLALACS